ncbi:hypothetical protein ABEB36_015490 [Hypothenemus hampei]|uniref:Uncharacterized protein n=1 Tax=Hypothenemus hampei TaxID=57062 RepID=A0ABD1E0H7_HYPHA
MEQTNKLVYKSVWFELRTAAAIAQVRTHLSCSSSIRFLMPAVHVRRGDPRLGEGENVLSLLVSPRIPAPCPRGAHSSAGLLTRVKGCEKPRESVLPA